MFAGVARYVCRPQKVDLVIRVESTVIAALSSLQSASDDATLQHNASEERSSAAAQSALPMKLTSICGNDTKLANMLKKHLDTTLCTQTKLKGIDLDTMLRRDHSIPLDDFMTLSTVNRKILLLDSLKRYNADVATAASDYSEGDVTTKSLSAAQRHDMILERGRDLLLELHRNAKKQQQ